MTWLEARLKPGVVPHDFYKSMDNAATHVHHFWDEPWHRHAFVVRLRGADRELIAASPFVDHVVEWDPSPDAELYGDYWLWVQRFFESGSILSGAPVSKGKLIHCFLNSRGMSEMDEARWALRFAWERVRMAARVKWNDLR